jgi:hypothetical protein
MKSICARRHSSFYATGTAMIELASSDCLVNLAEIHIAEAILPSVIPADERSRC